MGDIREMGVRSIERCFFNKWVNEQYNESLFRGNPILALVVLDIVFCMRGILQERCFEGCGSLKEKYKNIKRKI